jgi:hypothetical protein
MASSQYTLADVLSQANPNLIADALKKVNLGSLLQKQVESLSPAAASFRLAKRAFSGAAITAVVSSGANAGVYIVGEAIGNANLVDAVLGTSAGIASLGADGKTLTFKSSVAACIVTYMAASEIPLSDIFADFV